MIEGATSGLEHQQKLVCFCLHDQELAASIDDVKETLVVPPITPVFLTPAWLLGIINLRGDIVAVLDLAQLLDLPPTLPTDSSRIIVARHDGRRAGILVDRMAELRTLDTDELQPPPATLSDGAAAFIRGIATVEGGRPVPVLDLPALFGSEQLAAFRRQGHA